MHQHEKQHTNPLQIRPAKQLLGLLAVSIQQPPHQGVKLVENNAATTDRAGGFPACRSVGAILVGKATAQNGALAWEKRLPSRS